MAGRKIGEIYGEIKLKNQQFNTGLKQSQSKLQGFKMKSVAIFAAVAAASYALVKGIGTVVKASSDLEEVTAKFGTVFKGHMDKATESVKLLTKSYGMSTREARQHMAAVQDLLVPMGMMRGEASNLSEEIVKLATDIGSFNNLPTADAMRKIQSALVGMYRPMRDVGVVLSATTVEQRALNMGLADTSDKLTVVHKAMAAYAMMVEGSRDALGDFIRTSDSYANRVKAMNAMVENLKAAIGDFLLPVLADWVGYLTTLAEQTKILVKEVDTFIESLVGLRDIQISLAEPTMQKFLEKQIIYYKGLIARGEQWGLVVGATAGKMDEWRDAVETLTGQLETLRNAQRDIAYDIPNKVTPAVEEFNRKIYDTKVTLEAIEMINKNKYSMWNIVPNKGPQIIDVTSQVETHLAESKRQLEAGTEAAWMFVDTLVSGFMAINREGATFEDKMKVITGAFLRIAGFAVGGPAGASILGGIGSIFGFQKGGFVPGQIIPQVSSGYVQRPSVLVGEGKGGELVIPEDKLKGMVQVTIHNANPHTYVETLLNLPQSEWQRLYRRGIKEAADREGRR